jgi:hypothetical protein
MEYGSAFGHGAYLGPDYTADYLRRSSNLVRQSYGGPASDAAARKTIEDMRTNRYEAKNGTLTFSAAEAGAFRKLVPYYSRFFSDPNSEHGLRPNAITNRMQLRQLTALFAWTAWAAAAKRPGHNYSYTNNWPSEPRVDNTPTANVIVWSVLSLIALLGRHRPPLRSVRPRPISPRRLRLPSLPTEHREFVTSTRISSSFERRGRASSQTSANRFRTPRYVNDQSKQPSLDHDSRALNLARSPSADSRDEFANPTGRLSAA